MNKSHPCRPTRPNQRALGDQLFRSSIAAHPVIVGTLAAAPCCAMWVEAKVGSCAHPRCSQPFIVCPKWEFHRSHPKLCDFLGVPDARVWAFKIPIQSFIHNIKRGRVREKTGRGLTMQKKTSLNVLQMANQSIFFFGSQQVPQCQVCVLGRSNVGKSGCQVAHLQGW